MSGQKCRRCLLRELEQGQELYEAIKARREKLPPEERASDEAYEARLALCRQCQELQNATCMQCGCYVESRAAKQRMYCPLGRW